MARNHICMTGPYDNVILVNFHSGKAQQQEEEKQQRAQHTGGVVVSFSAYRALRMEMRKIYDAAPFSSFFPDQGA